MDESLEVARLRRELKQARLELLNRESNFNRVFTQVQPVHVTSSSDQKVPFIQNYLPFFKIFVVNEFQNLAAWDAMLLKNFRSS